MRNSSRRFMIGRASRQIFRIASVALLGLAAGATAASAQNAPQSDVSGGYFIISDSMDGWYANVSGKMTPHLSLVGQFDSSSGQDCETCRQTYHDMAGLGGVRLSWHPGLRVSPFFQVLAGALHSAVDGYYYETVTGYDPTSKQWIFKQAYQAPYSIEYAAIQPGGGATVMITPRFGMRAQTDFQIAMPDSSKYEGISLFPRFMVGGVVRLGR